MDPHVTNKLGTSRICSEKSAAAPAGRGRRQSILRGAKIVGCLALLTWIVSGADLGAVWSAMSGADPRLLALALGMQVVGAAIIALRWQRLLAVRGVRPGFVYLLGSTVSAFFFRQFLPSVVGGDAIRSYDAWRAGARPGFAALSLVADRLFGLLALIGFVAVAALSMNRVVDGLPGLWLWSGIALAVVGGGLLLLLMPGRVPVPARAPARLHRMVDAMRVFQGARGIVLPCLGLSILLQVNVVTFYWVLSESLGLQVPYAAFYAIVPIAIFAMMAPFTINGIGVREAVFIFLLGLWGVDATLALAFAWIEFGTVLAAGILGGAVHALRRGPRGRTRADRPGDLSHGT